MKKICLLIFMSCIACNQPKDASKERLTDTIQVPRIPITDPIKPDTTIADSVASSKDTINIYNNERFKNVSVKRLNETEFEISGKARVFEATFSWVVEDGHNELTKGHVTTDSGAPEWGNFNFKVKTEKANRNSTLHLILFEASPKDGSRQYTLSIPLY